MSVSKVAVSGLAVLAALAIPGLATATAHAPLVRVIRISYRAHDGHMRDAIVLLPHGYRPKNNLPIPLIISPHGRGVDGELNSRLWRNLPTIGGFAVVNPDGQGRVLPLHSWGAPGQIADLHRLTGSDGSHDQALPLDGRPDLDAWDHGHLKYTNISMCE